MSKRTDAELIDDIQEAIRRVEVYTLLYFPPDDHPKECATKYAISYPDFDVSVHNGADSC